MKAVTAISWATIYLILLYVVPNYTSSPLLMGLLYVSFPVIFILMVIIVLKDDSVKSKELRDDDEFGYADKNKEDLWIIWLGTSFKDKGKRLKAKGERL